MPSWTYSISIVNNTDRALEVFNVNIPWGKETQTFPGSIDPGKTGEFKVCSPAANPTGIEFYFSLRDVVPNGDKSYGIINFSLDMPYWKHENSSSLECGGSFKQEGFKKIPDGAHDFATSVTIYSVAQASGGVSSVEPQYHDIYDWEGIKKLAIIDPANTNIESIIPDSNILFDRRTEKRTNTIDISKEMWDQINDKRFSDNLAKEDNVKSYFAVSVYEVRKNSSFTIPAGQDYSESVDITRGSVVKKEVSSDLQIENTLNLSIGEGKRALSDVLMQSFGIRDIRTFSTESTETVKQAMSFVAADHNRDIVLWDVVKVVAIYREGRQSNIELVGVGDYHVATVTKVYGGN